jgi:hypothetical protein
MRYQALDDYRHAVTVWATLAPYVEGGESRPPSLPAILRDVTRDDA